MIRPEAFDIVQRGNTPQCRIRVEVVAPREYKRLDQHGKPETVPVPGVYVWLSDNQWSDPIHTVDRAAHMAVAMAKDMWGEDFANGLIVYFQKRGMLPPNVQMIPRPEFKPEEKFPGKGLIVDGEVMPVEGGDADATT
jgi:hypothetical protein